MRKIQNWEHAARGRRGDPKPGSVARSPSGEPSRPWPGRWPRRGGAGAGTVPPWGRGRAWAVARSDMGQPKPLPASAPVGRRGRSREPLPWGETAERAGSDGKAVGEAVAGCDPWAVASRRQRVNIRGRRGLSILRRGRRRDSREIPMVTIWLQFAQLINATGCHRVTPPFCRPECQDNKKPPKTCDFRGFFSWCRERGSNPHGVATGRF